MPQREKLDDQTARKLFLERAAAYYDDLNAVIENAPHGKGFDHAEAFAVAQGKELIRQSLETIVQQQIDHVEKKNETRLCSQCQTKKRHRGNRKKKRMSTFGKINLERRYDECMPCRLPEFIADDLLGLEGRCSVGFRRIAVYAGAEKSCRDASGMLKELCGLKVSPNTLRDLCHEEAPKMEQWMEKSPEVQKEFVNAPGNVEVTMDGTIVNTTEGSREVKVGLISKRTRGQGVLPEQWGNRNKQELPDIETCIAFASVEECGEFQKRIDFWRRQLRLGSTSDISILGDGAVWIWNIGDAVFGKVRECLDVYHGLKHVSDTGKVLYGERTESYEQWRTETTLEFVESGFELIEKRLFLLEQEERTEQERESLRLLRGYLENNRERLCYCERLAEGRVIGSGQVEGACKNLIGKRLKQTWAKWLVPRLNRMAMLCAIRYCDQWEKYWRQAK